MTGGQQGINVLFFIDHATKGDAFHHAIQTFVHEDSSEMKLLTLGTALEIHKLRSVMSPTGESTSGPT